MIQLSKKYTFMEPEIACKETGFEGRSDIILYYDMLNRITNFSKLNELIKKYNIRSLADSPGVLTPLGRKKVNICFLKMLI